MQTKIDNFAVSLLLIASAVWILFRLHLGVDFSDESWYVATNYRMLLGDRPYVDEIFLMQGFSLVTYPFFRLFGFAGSSEGIVLFGRYLYSALNLLAAVLLVRTLRKYLSWGAQALLVVGWLAFIPYGIPNVSYNTLGLVFVTMGFCALAGRCLYSAPLTTWYAYGLCMGLGLLSHPSNLLVCVVAGFSVLVLERQRKAVALGLYVLGGITVGIIALICYQIPVGALRDNYLLTVVMNKAFNNAPGMEKLFLVLGEAWRHGPWITMLILVAGWHPRLARYRNGICAVTVLLILPLTFWQSRARLGGMGPHGTTFFLGMLAPALVGYLRDRRGALVLVVGGWLPSAVAALATSITSYNGLRSSGVPSLLCASVTLTLVVAWWRQTSPEVQTGRRLHNAFGLVPLALFLALQIYGSARGGFYFEDPIQTLNTRLDSGPFRGLYTSQYKAGLIKEYERVIGEAARPGARIAFYPTFPAGYLMTRMAPLLPTTWGCMGLPANVCWNYVLQRSTENDVWVRVNRFYYFQDKVRENKEPEFFDEKMKHVLQLQTDLEVFTLGKKLDESQSNETEEAESL